MEENQKSFKILSDCAEIAEQLKNNPNITSSHIHLKILNIITLNIIVYL